MKRIIILALGLVMTLMIQAELLPYPTTEHKGKLCYVYPVEKSIGLYRISLNFGVPQQTIIQYNPQLKTRGLRYGESLFIPVNERDIAEAKAAASGASKEVKATAKSEGKETKKATEEVESAVAEAEGVVTEAEDAMTKAEDAAAEVEEVAGRKQKGGRDLRAEANRIKNQGNKRESLLSGRGEGMQGDDDEAGIVPKRTYGLMDTLRVALMLPLHANTTERTLAMDRFVDFYEGALIAVYDAQATGLPIALHVYDTEKGTTKLNNILAKREMAYMDGILGPAYPNQVEVLSRYVERHKIPTLIPFTDQVKNIENNPYLLQFNAPVADEAEALVTTLAKDSLVNWIFVEAEERDIPESVLAIRRAVKARGLRYTMTTVHRILSDSLEHDMVRGKENVLVLNTEKFANARLMMSHIASSAEGRMLTLVSQYGWQKERVLLPQVFVTEFATDGEPDMSHYNHLYSKYFGHEHAGDLPRYDLLGYDLMNELIGRVYESYKHKGLQSDIEFRRVNNEEGGYKNVNLHVVRK